jgi:hypothetical protein
MVCSSWTWSAVTSCSNASLGCRQTRLMRYHVWLGSTSQWNNGFNSGQLRDSLCTTMSNCNICVSIFHTVFDFGSFPNSHKAFHILTYKQRKKSCNATVEGEVLHHWMLRFRFVTKERMQSFNFLVVSCKLRWFEGETFFLMFYCKSLYRYV